MSGGAKAVPPNAPTAAATILTACPGCGAEIKSMMAHHLRECGEPSCGPHPVRREIRRKPERMSDG